MPRRAAQARAEAAEAEQERVREERQKSARPVTLDDFEPGPAMTLREAGERVARAGGVVQEADGRLLVSLPGSARSAWSSALEAARRLYLCEPIVLERLKSGKPLPDKAVLPSGKLEP